MVEKFDKWLAICLICPTNLSHLMFLVYNLQLNHHKVLLVKVKCMQYSSKFFLIPTVQYMFLILRTLYKDIFDETLITLVSELDSMWLTDLFSAPLF